MHSIRASVLAVSFAKYGALGKQSAYISNKRETIAKYDKILLRDIKIH